MCDVSGCSSEVGSGSVSDDGRDAMLDILEEFQRLYQGRLARLERDPGSPSYGKDKMDLLEDWIGDLNQQNRTLVETVKELETEASQRCEMLESRLVSTTSSTKQYMLQLHQLQRQVQQLLAGRLQAESRVGEMTSLVDELTAENEQLRRRLQLPGDGHLPADTGNRRGRCGSGSSTADRPPSTAGCPPSTTAGEADGTGTPHTADQTSGGDVTSHVQRLKADLSGALRDRDDLQEILDIRKCDLEESQSEVASLRWELDRLRSTLGTAPPSAGPAAGAGAADRHQLVPPAEVHRLQKHCRDLVDQRNEALAELAKVKVTLMEVMEQQVEKEEEESVPPPAEETTASESDGTSEQGLGQAPPPPPPAAAAAAVRRQPTAQLQNQRIQNQLEERDQLVAALQAHLESSRNEVSLKDETLERLENKLEAARHDLSATSERLAGADGERAALGQQNQILNKQILELHQRAEEAAAVSRRLESEADQQMEQITQLQERLLAAETSNKHLTAKCVEKDVEIGRQWTTISSLQEALLEAKQQVAALQPAPSFLGGLLGGASTKKQADEIKKLHMDLAVARSQFKEAFSESARQASVLEQLREENRQLGEALTRERSEVTALRAGTEAAISEPSCSDVALVEAMFERLQTELCGLADTLGQDQGQGHLPPGQDQGQGHPPLGQDQGQGHPPLGQDQGQGHISPGQGHSAVPVDRATQTEEDTDTEQEDWQTVGCCEHQLQLTQQRDVTEYLRRLLRKRAAGAAADLTPSLGREVSQLSQESRLWRRRVSQGQRQLTDLRHSLVSLRDSVDQCKNEETLVSELRRQLQDARDQLQQQAALSQQLAQLRLQVDQLILEKQHQQTMIRELRSDLAASEDGASAAQQAEAARLTEQLDERRDAEDKLSQQVQQLTAEHAECADQRGRLEARLAEAHAQLAETLCGQDQVHSQADLIVDHVSAWVAEWRAENERLARRVDQQTETITVLQLENRRLSERLAVLCGPAPCSVPPATAEPFPASLTDRYPGSFTEGFGLGPAPPPPQQYPCRHQGCPAPGRPAGAGPASLPSGQPGTATGDKGVHTQSLPAVVSVGIDRRPSAASGDDHVPTRDSDRGWPAHLVSLVSELQGSRPPPPPPQQQQQQQQQPAGGCRAALVVSLLLCLSLGALQLWQMWQTAELRDQLQRQQRRLTTLEQDVTNVLLASAVGPVSRRRRSVTSAAQSVSPAGIPIVDRPYGHRPGLRGKQTGLRFYDTLGTVSPSVDNPTILPHHRSSAVFAGRQLGRVNSDPAPTDAEPQPAAAAALHHHSRPRAKQAATKVKKARRGRRRRLPRKRVHVKRAEAKRLGVKRVKMRATKSRPAAEARGAPISFTTGPSSISGDHRRTASTPADHQWTDLLVAPSRRRFSSGPTSQPAGGAGTTGQRRPAAAVAGSGGGQRRGRRLMRMMDELRQELGTTVAHLEGHTSEYSLDHPHYDGNGVLRNVQPNARFADWRFAPWVHRLGYSKDFLLNGGRVTVKRPGVYYLYAQINYLDPSDINGFEMMVSGQSFAKCLTMESTDHQQKVNTCHTSGVNYLEAGDTVSIRDLEMRRISMFLPDRSFFGLVRLAGTGDTGGARRQRRSHDDWDN